MNIWETIFTTDTTLMYTQDKDLYHFEFRTLYAQL